MPIEILQSTVSYQAGTKLLELAVEVAETKNLNKVKDKISKGAKIHRWLQALDYSDYLTKATRDQIVRCLIEIADVHSLGVAPVLGSIEPPSIVVGIPGAVGATGADGAEGGGVPFSATSVTIDTICDSFPITDSRGVEFTINIYDDSGSDMRTMRLQGGWSADGSVYGDDGGIGTTIQGDTSPVTMSIVVSGTTVQLFAAVTSGTWTIEGTRKYVPNNGNGIVSPTTLAEGKIWVGNASNSPVAVTPSGDATITTAGVVAIATGVIVNADLSATAAVAVSKLAAMGASLAVATDASGFLTTVAGVSPTEVGYLANVTSDIQTQLDSKVGSASGAISTVVSTNLTVDRVVISNALGKIAVSSVTSAELLAIANVLESASSTQLTIAGEITFNTGATPIISCTDTTNGLTVKVDAPATGFGADVIIRGGDSGSDDAVAGGDVEIFPGLPLGTNGTAGSIRIRLQLGTGSGDRGHFIITQIPTSSVGLPTGAVWSDSNTLKIVP